MRNIFSLERFPYAASARMRCLSHSIPSALASLTAAVSIAQAVRTDFLAGDFTFDKDRNIYVCPTGKVLKSARILSDHMLRYTASTYDYGPCPLKSKCCPNTPQRMIPRDLNEDARDVARVLATTDGRGTPGCRFWPSPVVRRSGRRPRSPKSPRKSLTTSVDRFRAPRLKDLIPLYGGRM